MLFLVKHSYGPHFVFCSRLVVTDEHFIQLNQLHRPRFDFPSNPAKESD